jgi:methylmalonyl-CoA mutase
MTKLVADLAQNFTTPTFQEWEEAVKKSLKGRTVSELNKKTEDDIIIEPLYCTSSTPFPALAPDNRNFITRPRIDLPNIEAARAQTLEEIENETGGLLITLKGATAQPFGIDFKTEKDVERFLESLPISRLSLRLEAGDNIPLSSIFMQAGFASAHPGFDIIGRAASKADFSNIEKDFGTALAFLETHKRQGAGFVIDARLYHNAGASDAQELGLALATAAENFRHMLMQGVPASAALRRMSLLLATDARQFASLIKLRAMRLLWARFSEIAGGQAQSVHLSAETSWRMLTMRDPHTNLIRNTLAAFSAIIGGAEKITILPFTSALGLPDAFARRLARNTLNILRDESHLAKVQDAARGSAHVEDMTIKLSKAAWAIFQAIEKQGGILKALQTGEIQRAIAHKRDARAKAYREHEKEMIGITAFTDPKPQDVAVLERLPDFAEKSLLAINLWRDAEVFEKTAKKKEAAA